MPCISRHCKTCEIKACGVTQVCKTKNLFCKVNNVRLQTLHKKLVSVLGGCKVHVLQMDDWRRGFNLEHIFEGL